MSSHERHRWPPRCATEGVPLKPEAPHSRSRDVGDLSHEFRLGDRKAKAQGSEKVIDRLVRVFLNQLQHTLHENVSI